MHAWVAAPGRGMKWYHSRKAAETALAEHVGSSAKRVGFQSVGHDSSGRPVHVVAHGGGFFYVTTSYPWLKEHGMARVNQGPWLPDGPERAAPRSSRPGHVARRKATYRGVVWYAGSQRWKASISVSGKRRHLGYFDTEEEAAKAYDEAALLNHGPGWQHLNFPLEEAA